MGSADVDGVTWEAHATCRAVALATAEEQPDGVGHHQGPAGRLQAERLGRCQPRLPGALRVRVQFCLSPISPAAPWRAAGRHGGLLGPAATCCAGTARLAQVLPTRGL